MFMYSSGERQVTWADAEKTTDCQYCILINYVGELDQKYLANGQDKQEPMTGSQIFTIFAQLSTQSRKILPNL